MQPVLYFSHTLTSFLVQELLIIQPVLYFPHNLTSILVQELLIMHDVLYSVHILTYVFLQVLLLMYCILYSALIPTCNFLRGSRGNSVSIVSCYGLDDRAIEVRFLAGAEDFSFSLCVQTGSGAYPASCIMGTGVPFPGDKARPGRDAIHSPLSIAEVVNE
jgi:hypothetical protein